MILSRDQKAREVAERIGASKGHQPRESGRGYLTRCTAPGHDDPDPDLRVDPGTRAADVVIRCHSRGCNLDDILTGAGMTKADLYIEPPQPRRPSSRILAEYSYRYADGTEAFAVRRLRPDADQVATGKAKTFSQGRYDSGGRWTSGLGPDMPADKRPPYLLPELFERQPTVLYCAEGERDVHTLTKLGVAATTNAGGAKGWGQVQTRMLPPSIQQIIIVPDNDEAGRERAWRLLAAFTHGGRYQVKIQAPPLPHKDITDLIEAGGSLEDLVEWVPGSGVAETEETFEEPEDEEEDLAPILTDVLPFPVALMPEPLQALLLKRGSMPAEYLAGFGLAAASAVIPGAELVIDRHITERAADWFVIIAEQSSGKSGARRVAAGQLMDLERDANDAFAQSLHEFYSSGSKGRGKTPQNEPPDKALTLDNFTTEALIKSMCSGRETKTPTYAKSPVVDELARVVHSWGRYSGRSGDANSADRAFWLEMWDGNGINQRRVSSPPVIIRYAYATLAGGLQPAKLSALGDDSDGMVGRFLPFGTPAGTPKATYADKAMRSDRWDRVLATFYRNALTPRRWVFDDEGDQLFTKLCRNYQEQASTLSSYSAALAGKMGRHLPRLILTLSEISAARELDERLASTSTERVVPIAMIEAAAAICTYCMSYWASQVMFTTLDASPARRSVNAELSQLFDFLRGKGGGAMVKEVQRRKKYDRRGLDRLVEEFRAQGGQVFTVRYLAGGQVGQLLTLPGVDPRPLVPADAELKEEQ